jgi:hypothetical protein
MTTQTDTWPENVLARYLTIGGATVNLYNADQWSPVSATCAGCSTSNLDGGPDAINPKKWAQAHAERCRAMPKPTL